MYFNIYRSNSSLILSSVKCTLHRDSKISNNFIMEQQEIIIRLIKDHLVNTRLIHGLSALGLCPDDYYLHLSDTIFKMIGIPDENEELYHV